MKHRQILPAVFLLAGLHTHAATSDPERDGDWAVMLGRNLALLDQQPADGAARKAA